MLQMEVLKNFVFNSLTDRNVIVLKYYIMFFVLETPDDQILATLKNFVLLICARTGWVSSEIAIFADFQYCINADIVDGSEKVQKCADVI